MVFTQIFKKLETRETLSMIYKGSYKRKSIKGDLILFKPLCETTRYDHHSKLLLTSENPERTQLKLSRQTTNVLPNKLEILGCCPYRICRSLQCDMITPFTTSVHPPKKKMYKHETPLAKPLR